MRVVPRVFFFEFKEIRPGMSDAFQGGFLYYKKARSNPCNTKTVVLRKSYRTAAHQLKTGKGEMQNGIYQRCEGKRSVGDQRRV